MTTLLPDPPDPLPDLVADHATTLPTGSLLMRVHDVGGHHPRQFHEPRHYGPMTDRGRFDHHPPGPPRTHPDHGIIYAACDDPSVPPPPPLVDGMGALPGNVLDTVVAELVQDAPHLHLSPGLTLTVAATAAPLDLLDVRSSWSQITRAGTHLSTAEHHRVHPWARAIRATYPQLHGVLNVPATGGRAVAVALNESAVPALQAADIMLSRPFIDLPVINAAAQRLHIGVTY